MHVVKASAVLVAASLCLAPASFLSAQTKAPPKDIQYLFVQTAKNVSFKDGVLTLQDASPVTAFFSDRPNRIVGQVRNDLFMKQWNEGKNSFKSDPPNAVLTVFSEGSRPAGAVVVLSNPRIEGSALKYDTRLLKGTPPPSGTETTLVIDGGGAPCDPQFDTGDSSYPCWAQQAFSAAQGG